MVSCAYCKILNIIYITWRRWRGWVCNHGHFLITSQLIDDDVVLCKRYLQNLITFVSWDPSHERKNLIVKVISQVIEVNHPIERSNWKKDYYMSRWQKQPKHKPERHSYVHSQVHLPSGNGKKMLARKVLPALR